MKSKPDKGFIKELAKKAPEPKPKKPFTYSKPITPESKEVNGMHTPHRMREFKSVKVTTEFTQEMTSHIKKRRGE